MDVVLAELRAPVEERQLDDEVDPDDVPAEALDETGDRLHRPAGREDVVVDDDPRALADRVRVDLERVLAVLQGVPGGDGLRGELARPPRRDEAAADLARDRRAEPEPARLRAEDEVGLALPRPLGEHP